MDANKLKVLREIDYTISPHCGVCVWADLSPNGWGYCGVHSYQHLKHSEETSRLSIHRTGSCETFSSDPVQVAAQGLGGFQEFLKG